MPSVFKIPEPLYPKYHGCGYALAAAAGGQLVDLVYLRDVLGEFDDDDGDSVRACLDDARLGPTIRLLSGYGEVFVGMCSCYEFVEL